MKGISSAFHKRVSVIDLIAEMRNEIKDSGQEKELKFLCKSSKKDKFKPQKKKVKK